MTLHSKTRLIRKYPNRRLYDTEESRYITFADIRDLVLQRANFEVVDKRTGENITRCILLQVICEEEQNGQAVLSENFLATVIRAYGRPTSDLLAECLEDTVELFLSQQGKSSRDTVDIVSEHP